jgi:hypothetical protein
MNYDALRLLPRILEGRHEAGPHEETLDLDLWFLRAWMRPLEEEPPDEAA